MPYEIVYTSSNAGLQPGSKGFCTVAATNGIPPATLKLLESLSGYRHTHVPSAGPNPNNPRVFSHVILPTGESLLSRVVDAGLDYSGRTNKLAHHLVLLSSDRPTSGPSRVQMSNGMMIEAWEGDSRYLAPRRISALPELSGPCDTWKQTTGDAGWAGELANTAKSGNSREAYIVFSEGMNCLALVDEALSLLPPKERWSVTFSTFFTSLPVNIKCQWRFVLKGSKEHQSIPPHSNIFKLDLAEGLSPAPDSSLAEAARTGNRPSFATVSKPIPEPATQALPLQSLSKNPARKLPSAKSPITNSDDFLEEPDLGFATVIPETFNVMPPSTGYPMNRPFAIKKKSPLPIILTAIVAGLVGLILGGAGFFAINQFSVADKNKQSELAADKETSLKEVKKELEDAKELIAEIEKENTTQKKKLEILEPKLVEIEKELASSKNDLVAKAKELEAINSKNKKAEEKIAALEKQNPLPSTPSENSNKKAPVKAKSQSSWITLHLVEETKPKIPKATGDEFKVVRLISSDGTSYQELEKENTFYVVKTNDGLGTASVKEFRDSRDFLDATKDWFDSNYKNGMKDLRGLYIKTNNKESLYRFGISDMITITSAAPIDFAIPDLKHSSFEISNFKQSGVDWKLEAPHANQTTWSWTVEGRGDEIRPVAEAGVATESSTSDQNKKKNSPPESEFKVFVATLTIESKKNSKGFSSTWTRTDGQNKSKAEADNLKSVKDLTKQVKDQILTFDLLLKNVELKWDKDRKVDVKIPLKIKFE